MNALPGDGRRCYISEQIQHWGPMPDQELDTTRKALSLNLDPSIYGTIAEIGAGQEVAHNFFSVGAAAGTVAKTMSAYDMKVSDDIYGKARRYVSRERLVGMLEHEYGLLIERLEETRGEQSRFFAFADTVSARNYKGTNECHGWMGIRYRLNPGEPPRDIQLHVRMLDTSNLLQQQALGKFGVNLVYAAYHHHQDADTFIRSLVDDLGTDRIEVDLISFSGPDYDDWEDQAMALKLLRHDLTNAVMIDADGTMLQPSEALYKKPLLIERGSFKPVTLANMDMLHCGKRQFLADTDLDNDEPLTLFELNLDSVRGEDGSLNGEILKRAEALTALGMPVLITDYTEYYRLATYLRRYTKKPIGIALGPNTLYQIFDNSYYSALDGGILEAFGLLFRQDVSLYVYPMQKERYADYFRRKKNNTVEVPSDDLISAENILVPAGMRHLYAHVRDTAVVHTIRGADERCAAIHSSEVRALLKTGDSSWKDSVPEASVPVIEKHGLFR